MALVSSRALHPDVLPERPVNHPWAYLITFSCYGTRLHGRPAGSVDRNHNAWRGRYREANRPLHDYERSLLRGPVARLNAAERALVLATVQQVCHHEEWLLHAAHVRSDHIHVVVSARADADRVMHKLKTYASRALNREYGKKKHRWTRHGSTAYIWKALHVDTAVDYVVRQQGRPMAVYENPNRWQQFRHW